MIKSKIMRARPRVDVQKINLRQMRIRRDAMSVGLRHYQVKAQKQSDVRELKMGLAIAKQSAKMEDPSFIWLKMALARGENPLNQWRYYITKDAPRSIVNEYKEFWGDVEAIYQEKIDKMESGLYA